ncbi:hypothetical protein GCM10009678_29060 [Actinomadura kijaniata]|uniref:Uncharacterized protein n=1 Tax=Actinomadura namibiensis TaxID=182080 RepID=A0A7W3LK09_ACTNM|nr:hypothetical protein [Actinomadura namibiensis]MBA8949508.1 hypothetical protein [Actinomadura namibiensis]
MIEINEDHMKATAKGLVIAVAVRVDGAWHATTWPTPLTYNQAITAMMLAERLATDHDGDDPLVRVWREELTE